MQKQTNKKKTHTFAGGLFALASLPRGNIYPHAQQGGGAFQNAAGAGPVAKADSFRDGRDPEPTPPEPKPSFAACNSRRTEDRETKIVAALANPTPRGRFVMEEEDFEITLFWPVRNKSQFLVRG